MSCHAFNIEDAKKYGVDAAIIIHNIRFWIDHNKANSKHIHDGYVWTYNSARAFSDLFPYWSGNKIQKLLKKLENDGVIITGNYNKSPYDKTKWYTLPEYNLQLDGLEASANRLNHESQNAEPIPDINKHVITDVKRTDTFHSEKRISLKSLSKKDFPLCHEASRVLSSFGDKTVHDMLTIGEWEECEIMMASVDCFDFDYFVWWMKERSHAFRKKPSLPNMLCDFDKSGTDFEQFYNSTFAQEWER